MSEDPTTAALEPNEAATLHKVDRGLRHILERSEDEIVRVLDDASELHDRSGTGIEWPPPGRRPPWSWVIDRRRPLRVRAVTRFTGNRSDLEAMGLDVRSGAQDVFTVTGTPRQLAALARQDACRHMKLPRALEPSVDNATAQAEITAVHSPRPTNPTGFTGAGVIVGITDSPLDVTHHGFRQPTGSHDTRVLYYWVQYPQILDALGRPQSVANPPGQTPHDWSAANATGRPDFSGLRYGRLYTEADINTALGLATTYGTGPGQICCVPEPDEHGTHVAGIVAGSGHRANWTSTPTFVGAAPDAVLVHVQLLRLTGALDTDATFEDAVLDGIRFCFEAGRFHNLPVVVSASQGTNWGSHSGTDDFDIGRDNMLNSFTDRSMLFSAGNGNSDDSTGRGRATGSVPAGAVRSLTLTAHPDKPVWLDIWHSGPELDYRINHGGQTSGWRTAGQDHTGTIGGQQIETERELESTHGLRSIRIYFGFRSASTQYAVDLRNPHTSGAASYNAWVGIQANCADLVGSTHDELTLGDTACAKSILTVGASAKRNPANPATAELVTPYSGAGPTFDGRIKPEIVAVGGDRDLPGAFAEQIMSTASDQVSGYIAMSGTSMATPLTAGAVACLVEAYSGHAIDQDTIKALLVRNANRTNLDLDPARPGFDASERNRYGSGRLRMIDAIDHVSPPAEVDLWIRTADDDYGVEPYVGTCFCGSPDIRVYEAGTSTETYTISWGNTYDVRVKVRNLGDSDAVGTTVRLRYSLPCTAPSAWFHAEDATDAKLVRTGLTVPALDSAEIVFEWRPEATELNAPSTTTHYCLLAEVDHPLDPFSYSGMAWDSNIKGTNNIALHNLKIE